MLTVRKVRLKIIQISTFLFLELDEWVFIIPAAADIDQWHPSIINFEGNTWVLLFTDSTMAHNFAKLNPEEFLSKDGSILYIPLKVKDALHMIYDLHAKGAIWYANQLRTSWLLYTHLQYAQRN